MGRPGPSTTPSIYPPRYISNVVGNPIPRRSTPPSDSPTYLYVRARYPNPIWTRKDLAEPGDEEDRCRRMGKAAVRKNRSISNG